MLNKYFLYLLMILISSIETYKELKQYDQITVYQSASNLYLSLDGFEKGDKIYINLEFEYSYYDVHYNDLVLKYRQSDTYSYSNDFDSSKFSTSYKDGYSQSGNSYTFYYTIKLYQNTNYLLLITPSNFNDKLTIKHVKNNPLLTFLIIIGIIVIIVIAIIIIAICLYTRRKRKFLQTTTLPQQNYPTTTYSNYQNYTAYPQQNLGTQLYVS